LKEAELADVIDVERSQAREKARQERGIGRATKDDSRGGDVLPFG
jgi:hypothetical protein